MRCTATMSTIFKVCFYKIDFSLTTEGIQTVVKNCIKMAQENRRQGRNTSIILA